MEKYLNVDEALEYLNSIGLTMSKPTIRKKTAERSIPFKKFGKRNVFLKSELDKWIEDQLKME